MSIMNPTNTTETEQRIKMRFAFAMSSFGRMFLPPGITPEMKQLCTDWSENIAEDPPLGNLYNVDRYFLELWKARNEFR